MRMKSPNPKAIAGALLAVIVALTAFPACKLLIDDEECKEDAQPVPFEVLAQRPRLDAISKCRLNHQNIEPVPDRDNFSAVELIITSQDDFDRYVTCHEDPGVDFAEQFVLAGHSKTHHQCVNIIEHRVYTLCDTLYYSVGITEADCLMPEAALYIVAVPIENLRYPIRFDIFWEDVHGL